MKQGEAWKLEILAEWLVHGLPVLWADPMFDIPSGDDLKNLCIIYSGVADKFVIDYSHCRISNIQGLIPLIIQ